jgi:hypothetical protein
MMRNTGKVAARIVAKEGISKNRNTKIWKESNEGTQQPELSDCISRFQSHTRE